ncbi:hypothetical protein [Escherichia coli]|uniref:hypothetical protein n=1 Tax=Escherichia coli TaxID=562 RepID=UPI0020308E1B|nr:hypothetical protein [Escherichia coli]
MVPDSQRGYAPTIHGISREHPGLVSARTGMKFTRVRYLGPVRDKRYLSGREWR